MSSLFKNEDYKPRLIDKTIEKYLKSCGAICIEGPKWCGKTWTSSYHSKSEFFVGNPENNFSNRELATVNPSIVLEGETPRMIDEWQEVPSLWDATRSYVDMHKGFGHIILTGSATPKTKGILHSGAGRIVSIKMIPMSLYESGDSSGVVSIFDLTKGNFKPQLLENISLEKIANLIVRGGWPKNIDNPNPSILPKSYVDKIIKSNLTDEDKKRFSSHRIELILKSLARNECTTASILKISKDINVNNENPISEDTVNRYIEAMDRMFLFNNQPPFDPNVRSSLRIKGASKRHFCDPSLACAILDLNEKKLLNDLNTFGFLFESLVERDLYVYAQSNNAKLYHYQNYKNEEIDAIIEFDDGSWCAFEIKLGANRIEEAALNLNKVCASIVNDGKKPPLFKAVICGFLNATYQRPNDNIYVIPITALKD